MPRETERRSVFRLPVHFPVPEWNGDPNLAVRWPRVLAGDEALVKRTFPVVADGLRTSADLAGTSGAVAAGGRQSGDGSRAGVATSKFDEPQQESRQKAYVLISFLACCGYAGNGNLALPRANHRRGADQVVSASGRAR